MSTLKTRALVLLGSIVLALVFLVPTFFKSSFKDTQWLSKPLSLGLDLSGGVHIVYEVQQEEAIRSKLQSTANSIRSELRDAKIALTGVKVPETRKLELTFLNDQTAERGKAKLLENHKDLQFFDKVADGTKSKLIYTVSDKDAQTIATESVAHAVETLRNRVDQFGVAEPLIQRVGTNRILLQMPGVSDVSSVRKVVGNVAKLEFRLLPTPGSSESTVPLKDKSGATVQVEDQVLMSGQDVAVARVSFDQGVNVSLTLTSEGARTFRKLTTENVGRQLAIILDNVVYSSPNINEPIGGGQASISGGFTVEEAKQLAVILRAGALPAPMKVMEERTVGPSLGAESVKKGITAIVAGFLLVALFMMYWYKKSGVVAVASLLLNLLFIIAILSAFGATMTLPGLAALALTVGVAVDSNVIIFERIKDELFNGASRDAAVRLGFDKAYTAILDSNLAAFFVGLILYFLGTGPVKGFAVTLCIGVCTTLFCAVFAARIAFDGLELKGKKFPISI
jgi:preprotein translocase subunit SecD